MSTDTKPFQADLAVSTHQGVALRNEATGEWLFKRRLKNGRLVPADVIPPFTMKAIKKVTG